MIVFLTMNVRGLGLSSKIDHLIHPLYSSSAAVIAAQETNLTSNPFLLPPHSRVLNDFFIFLNNHGSGIRASRGVLLAIRKSACEADTPPQHVFSDAHGRAILVRMHPRGAQTPILVASVYAPADRAERRLWFSSTTLSPIDLPLVMGGDFNVTCSPSERLPPRYERDPSTDDYDDFCARHGVVDEWRSKGRGPCYTWSSGRDGTLLLARLDRVLTSSVLAARVQVIYVQPVPASMTDHQAVVMELDLAPRPPRSAFWRLNVSLLKHERLLSLLRALYQQQLLQRRRHHSATTLWHALQINMRSTIKL